MRGIFNGEATTVGCPSWWTCPWWCTSTFGVGPVTVLLCLEEEVAVVEGRIGVLWCPDDERMRGWDLTIVEV